MAWLSRCMLSDVITARRIDLSNSPIRNGEGMKRRRTWIIVIVAFVLAGAGGYVAYTRTFAPPEEAPEPTLQTATVQRGDIVISADGSGELVTATESELAFRTTGTLEEILVEDGDQVKEGDVLARLDTSELEQAVDEADVELETAREELADVQAGPSQDELDDAQAVLRDAQLDLQVAYDAYQTALDSSSDGIDGEKAQYDWYVGNYQTKKAEFESGRISQTEHDQAMNSMIAAEGRWQAAINRSLIDQAQTLEQVNQAQEAVNQASEDLEILASGPLTDTLTRVVLAVDEALLARERAVAALDQAQLFAPFDGRVTAVEGTAGEQLGNNATVLTLANEQEPLVRFWVEEADLTSVAVGYPVDIVFEAWPDITVTGEIVRVEPALVTVDGFPAVQAWARLGRGSEEISLLAGMTAEIEVVAAETRNALLVPVGALRELSPGQYAVFVVAADGALEMRPVQVGLTDPVSAEILSGLQLGEVVSLGEGD
jgi:HlyD family secretion protein